MNRDVCEHFEPIALCERCAALQWHRDGLPIVDDAMVKRAARAYDHAGNKPTVGTFESAIRAALEAALCTPANAGNNRSEPGTGELPVD